MYQKLDCIALRTVKYSDRSSILSVYSRQEGRLSLLVPAGQGKQAARMRALLMPMGRFECVADIRPGREIYPFRDLRPILLPPVGDPVRSTLALFVTDLLSGLLKESMPDPLLFDFINRSIEQLSTLPTKQLANFHIVFLILLTRFLGIEPDWGSYREGAIFDLAEGIFRQSPPPHRNFLTSSDSSVAFTLRRISYRNLHLFAMSRFDRNRLLDSILHYYQLHYPSLPTLSSLPILRVMAD